MSELGTPFGQVLQTLAAADPTAPAVTCGTSRLTRHELLESVTRLAGRFAELGVSRGSLVTIGLPNSVEWAQAALATWWLGATPQPISNRLPGHERRAIVELARPALVIGLPSDESDGTPSLSIEELQSAAAKAPPTQLAPGVAPIWKAVTSGGSTGRPKLIMAVQPAVSENVVPLGALLRVPEGGTVLVTAPLSHNAPFVLLAAALLRGNHVIVMPRFDPIETLRLVERFRVGWLYLVPTMMHRIWRLTEKERNAFDLSSVDVAFHMAAPCPRWLKQAWIDWLGPDRVLELYGGTELQALTVITGNEWLDHLGSVGRAVIGEIECRGSDDKPVPPGEIGELWLRRGPGLPPPYEYVGASARRAADGWESLGDHGFVDEDGYVYITDRAADMILVGGGNVYPAEVEAALDEHPSVRSSCVIGLPNDDLGNVPHAIVELATPVADAALMAHLQQRLAPYKLPRSIERVTESLRDEAGKVRRSALRAERLASRGDARS